MIRESSDPIIDTFCHYLFFQDLYSWYGLDILSRIILPTVELPIGILTSLIGAPLFIYIFVKKGYEFGG